MRARIVQVSTRRSGATARRERVLEAEVIRIGRGTGNELVLNDLAVALHHATLRRDGAGIVIEAEPGQQLRVGRGIILRERVEPGDAIRLGAFEIRVVEAGPNDDVCVEVEQVGRRGDEAQELARRTSIGLERGWLTTRTLSWTAVTGVVVLFLVVPLATERCQRTWESGPMSRKHALLADDCRACHEPFARVRDESCANAQCHVDIGNHVDALALPNAHGGARCADCHVEHSGIDGLTEIDDPLCESCHGNIASVHPDSSIADVSDFGSDHPEFRIELVVDAARRRTESTPWRSDLEERSGLVFGHREHVGQPVDGPEGSVWLRCDTCHVSDEDGTTMAPVTFEEHCRGCHSLEFDPSFANVEARHGDPDEMRDDLRRRFAEGALRGDIQTSDLPTFLQFGRPDRELQPDEVELLDAWVDRRVARAAAHLAEDPGECARCHELQPGRAADGGFDVSPVHVATIWMTGALFRHDTHATFPCGDCHAPAAVLDQGESDQPRPSWSKSGVYRLRTASELQNDFEATPSEESVDVLVPGIDTCRGCHQGAAASPPDIASPCVMCHSFHDRDHGPMVTRKPESPLPAS